MISSLWLILIVFLLGFSTGFWCRSLLPALLALPRRWLKRREAIARHRLKGHQARQQAWAHKTWDAPKPQSQAEAQIVEERWGHREERRP